MIALMQDDAVVRPQQIGAGVTNNVAPITVHGTVDHEGRLVSADQPLLRLNRQAGGEDGGALAIPQVAALARLSQSLGISVSRTLIAADGDVDIDLTVQARPDGAVTRLAIDGWRQRATMPPLPGLRSERAQCVAELRAIIAMINH